MTARDERLEAVAKALRTLGYRPVGDPAESDAEDFLAMLDAARAFDEQRKDVAQTDTSAVSPVGADPPWLGEAAYEARKAWSPHAIGPLEEDTDYWRDWMTIARAVLRFAAAQPPSEAEIEQVMLFGPTRESARAILLAAARVRAGG